MSEKDIKQKVERVLSDILSDKHDAVINIQFTKKKERVRNGNNNSSRTINKK